MITPRVSHASRFTNSSFLFLHPPSVAKRLLKVAEGPGNRHPAPEVLWVTNHRSPITPSPAGAFKAQWCQWLVRLAVPPTPSFAHSLSRYERFRPESKHLKSDCRSGQSSHGNSVQARKDNAPYPPGCGHLPATVLNSGTRQSQCFRG